MADQCDDVLTIKEVGVTHADVRVQCQLERSAPRNHRRHEAKVLMFGRQITMRWSSRYDLTGGDDGE